MNKNKQVEVIKDQKGTAIKTIVKVFFILHPKTNIVFMQKLQSRCAEHVFFCCMHDYICVGRYMCMPIVVQ